MTMTSALIVKCSLLCNRLRSKLKSFLRNLNTCALPNNRSTLQKMCIKQENTGTVYRRRLLFPAACSSRLFYIYFGKGLHTG